MRKADEGHEREPRNCSAMWAMEAAGCWLAHLESCVDEGSVEPGVHSEGLRPVAVIQGQQHGRQPHMLQHLRHGQQAGKADRTRTGKHVWSPAELGR